MGAQSLPGAYERDRGAGYFAPIAIAVYVTGSGNEVTGVAAAGFFWARVVHAPIYIFEIPVLRLLSFMAGLAATLVLSYQLIR